MFISVRRGIRIYKDRLTLFGDLFLFFSSLEHIFAFLVSGELSFDFLLDKNL